MTRSLAIVRRPARRGAALPGAAGRFYCRAEFTAPLGLLGALQDPQIARAVSLIHRQPGREWTVASLADQIPMSRSALAARFTELVGESAMSYVVERFLAAVRGGDLQVLLDVLPPDVVVVAHGGGARVGAAWRDHTSAELLALALSDQGSANAAMVEVAGIEPASFGGSTGLLRAQLVSSLLGPTGLQSKPV